MEITFLSRGKLAGEVLYDVCHVQQERVHSEQTLGIGVDSPSSERSVDPSGCKGDHNRTNALNSKVFECSPAFSVCTPPSYWHPIFCLPFLSPEPGVRSSSKYFRCRSSFLASSHSIPLKKPQCLLTKHFTVNHLLSEDLWDTFHHFHLWTTWLIGRIPFLGFRLFVQ